MRRRREKCRMCDGTGKIVLLRSWLGGDGYRRERCGVCGGTGRSSFRPDARIVERQARLRDEYAEWRRQRKAVLG